MKPTHLVSAVLAMLLINVVVLYLTRTPTVEAQQQQQTTTPCRINGGVGSTGALEMQNCRNVGGSVRGLRFINTSSQLAFLKLYDLRTMPVCSSANGFQESIPIPYNVQGGGIVDIVTNWHFNQGVAYCLTGGPAANNASPPPAGVFGALSIGN